MTSQHDTTRAPEPGIGRQLQHLLEQAAGAAERLLRQGNRRRVTLTDRHGEVWVRLPLTLAVLVTLLLLPAWPVLVVLAVAGFAVGAQLSVERHEPRASATHAPAPDAAAPDGHEGPPRA